MRYRLLATDFDGTLARLGRVEQETQAALRCWRQAGHRLLLITGRTIAEITQIYPDIAEFDLVCGENGAMLLWPASGRQHALAQPSPTTLLRALSERGIPCFHGEVLIGIREQSIPAVRSLLAELHLDWVVIMNKGSVMLLPRGIDKDSGLEAALAELGESAEATVACGDAENDIGFMRRCGLSVAVANALDGVKAIATMTTAASHGAGVAEIIDRLLAAGEADPGP